MLRLPITIFDEAKEMTFKKTIFFPYVIFFLTFITYLFTTIPNIYWRDASEFQAIGFLLDIAHPSGSPLYAMTAKLFTFIPLGSIGFKVTLLSAFFGASISVILYLILQTILTALAKDKDSILRSSQTLIAWISLTTALLFSFSNALWENSNVSEVYTFQNFFTGLFIFIFIRFSHNIFASKSKTNQFKTFCTLSLLYGLSLGSHSILILYLPFLLILVYYIWVKVESLPMRKTYAFLSFFFLIGFSHYLYLPIRSTQNPFYDWGDPETFYRLMAHVSDRKDASYHFSFPVDAIPAQLKLYSSFFIDNFSILGVILGSIGFFYLLRNKEIKMLTVLALFFIPPFLFFIRWWGDDAAYLPNFFIFAILIGIGIWSLQEIIKVGFAVPSKRKGYLTLFWGLLGVQFLFLIFDHATENNKARYWSPREIFKSVLSNLPPNSVVFSSFTTFPSIYFQQVEGYRPDISIFSVSSFKVPDLFLKIDESKYINIDIPVVPANQLGSEFLTRNIEKHPIYWEPNLIDNSLVEKYLSPESFLFRVNRDPIELDNEAINSYLTALSKQVHFKNDVVDQEERKFYALIMGGQGAFFFQRGAYEIARRHFELAVGLRPLNTMFLNFLGISHAILEENQQAEAAFLRAISANSDLLDPYLNLGKLYALNEKYEDAEPYLKHVLEVNPEHLEALVLLGSINADMGNVQVAKDYYEKALTISPDDEEIKIPWKILQGNIPVVKND